MCGRDAALRSTRTLALIMDPYRFTVSLRLWHPSRNLSRAETVFGVVTARSLTRGDARRTPTGIPLPGVYPTSYWYANLTRKYISSKRQCAEQFLEQTIRRFRDRRAYLSRLRKSGGRAELFVILVSTKNLTLELHPELLLSAAHLGVTITLDWYPYAQNER